MKELFLIKRAREDNPFHALQEQSLRRLRELSGQVWTDFNIHDPGVTITDYLNYGLYDLHYRFTFPFECYLSADGKGVDGQAGYEDKGLFSRESLYTHTSATQLAGSGRTSIVTEEDYEELIRHHFAERIEKCVVRLNRKTLKYDVFILPKKRKADIEALSQLKNDIIRFYHQYRNLGETLGYVYFDPETADDKNLYPRKRYTKDLTYQFPEFDHIPDGTEDPVRPFVPDYHSIQYDFPENYNISQRGIPPEENADNEAKVLQLKAYLLIFDSLMAEQLQLAQKTTALFGLDGIPDRKLPDIPIVDGERLVDEERKRDAENRIGDHFYEVQKFRYLNLLDTLYGENTRTFFGKQHLPELNRKREGLMKKLPFFNEDRFRSFDVYDPDSTAVVEQIFYHVFNAGRIGRPVPKMKILSDREFFGQYVFLLNPRLSNIQDQTIIEHIPAGSAVYHEQLYKILRLHFNLIWHGVLFESLMEYGTDLSHYRILKYATEYMILFFHPVQKIWISMSLFFPDKQRLIELTYCFCDFIKQYQQSKSIRSIYLIEYILADTTPVEQYNRVAVVVPQDLPVPQVEELLRERLPVHLKITLYFIPVNILKPFQTVYIAWRKALSESADPNRHFGKMQSVLADLKIYKKEI